jgi:hypothetical protein
VSTSEILSENEALLSSRTISRALSEPSWMSAESGFSEEDTEEDGLCEGRAAFEEGGTFGEEEEEEKKKEKGAAFEEEEQEAYRKRDASEER